MVFKNSVRFGPKTVDTELPMVRGGSGSGVGVGNKESLRDVEVSLTFFNTNG